MEAMMRKLIKQLTFIGIVGLIVMLAEATINGVQAQSSGALAQQSSYSIEWYTIDGGGSMNSSGGSYSLGGSIGQPDAGSMGSGSYQLNGGFWGGASINYSIYLPLVLKSF
jgi:hypothetical protein